MKRIVLIGTAVAGLFTAGITTVATAATIHRKTTTVTTVKRETKTLKARAKCTLALTTVAPAGTTGVTPGMSSGDQWGAVHCQGLSSGAALLAYDTASSGDITGTIHHWFDGGMLSGTVDLAQSGASGPPTTTSFTSATYAGTVQITSGGGLLRGTTGSGKMMCTTQDSVHYACTESLSLKQKVVVLVKVKKTHR